MKLHLGIQTVKWAIRSLFVRTALCLVGGILLLSGSSQGCFIVGDLSGNCRVGIEDLALAASQWMQASCDAETGFIAHWKLNESSGSIAVDSSGSGYNGIVAGASWNPAGGVLGGALQFDGDNDYVWITQGYEGVTGSNPRTCAAWIKTDQPSGEIMTWGDMDVDTNGWVVWLDETGVLRVDVGGGYIFGTTVLTDDLWHHIAVTSDGSTTDNIVLYVDGRIETTAEVVSQSINTQGTGTVKLGVYLLPFLEGSYFSGLIDDARIYDRALSLQEIWSIAKTATTNYACADLNTDETVNLLDMARMSQGWDDASPIISINEFLADNESKSPLGPGDILDGNYESSDWIELRNNSEMVIDIGGWYLTDESNLKTKWQFPSGMGQLVLQPGDYFVIFASGKTQAENPGNYPYEDPAGYLHTNFQLSKSGEYLALIDADGTTPIHEYNHFEQGGGEYGYSDQEEDISYGYYYDETRYFSEPTPGTDNKSSFVGFAEKPDVNFKGGCYVNGFDLTMSCGTPDAFIQYTTDGTVPSLVNGTEYTIPIHIDSLTTLIAKSFKPGLQRSDARIETYIFIQSAVAAFNSNLPIIVIDTLGEPIINDPDLKPYADCRAVIIDTDDTTGRADITGPEHFAGLGQIRRRGESTYGQGHYAFEIQDEYGDDKDVSLLSMPAESDWIINKEVIDYTLLKSHIAFKWFRDMGHYAPRERFVEVYLNTGGGAISTGDYKGIYVLREKIKRNDDRVDIARLDASHNLEPKVSGGYIIKNDKEDAGDVELEGLETSPYGIVIDGHTSIVEPKVPTSAQITWISNYMNEFHAVLWQNTGSSHYVPGVDYTDYVDEISWIDHGLVEQIGNDPDAFRFSYFLYKDRGGKLCSGPPWDFDRAFHNNAGNYDRPYTGWDVEHKIPGKWHLGLQQNLEYNMMLADRWFEHREEVLNTDKTMAYIDETVALVSEAMDRTIDKYGFPGDGGTYAGEINLFKNWIIGRLDWLDGDIANRFGEKPPIFSPLSSYVNQGDPLYMSKPSGASGTIYYTLNGEDPRLEGGSINPDADAYSGTGVTINSLVTMSSSSWKYLYDGSDQGTAWRAFGFNDNSWDSGPGQLGFGEGDEDTNIGPKVNGRRTAYFRHKFNASNVSEITALTINILHDDGAVVYISNQHVDRTYMPGGTIYFDTFANVQGENSTTVFSGISLSILNEGDNILAVEVHQRTDSSSDISFDLSLEATRPPGGSSQIVLNKSTCVRARIKDGGNWSAQNKEVYGVGPILENLRITELMYHPTDPTPAEKTAAGDPNLIDEDFEFIELKNIGVAAFNLNLVHFTDGIDFTFADYTLAAGEYTVLVKNQVAFAARYGTSGINIVPGNYVGSLDNGGEEIVLRDAIGEEIHDFDYNDAWYDITDGGGFSLTIKDASATDPNLWDEKAGWRPSAAVDGSPGVDDTGVIPEIGSIVINEILAHSDVAPNDWIELHNTTGSLINIGNWYLSDDAGDLTKYKIAPGASIAAGGYIVFTQDDDFGGAFALSENGETLYLHSGDGSGLTGYSKEESFGASESEVAFGRYQKSTGTFNFVAMSSNTPGASYEGAANAYPKVGPIIINEIMYHPTDLGGNAEYLELKNITGSPVTLYDSDPAVLEPWKMTDGIQYTFPSGSPTTIAAGDYFLLIKDLTAFTNEYGAPTPGKYAVWTSGSLNNGGEKVEISMPGDEELGIRYHIRVDRINYDDDPPWPPEPDDGITGTSLSRISPSNYGNDVDNWQSAATTPGTVNP